MQETYHKILEILEKIRTMTVDSPIEMAVFGAVLAFALLNSVLGYRLLRFWVMLIGFAVGAGAGFFIVNEMEIKKTFVYFAAMLGFGIVLALIAFLIYRAGIFIMASGIVAAACIYLIHPRTSAAFFLCLLIGAVTGTLAIRFERGVIIFVTSLLGGVLSGFCISKMLQISEIPYGIMIAAGIFILGLAVQLVINRPDEDAGAEETDVREEVTTDRESRREKKRERRDS